MAGWSSLGSVEDRRLAQSLLDGVPGTFAEVYDFYAARLYDYCHALLRDQELAADALHDSLIAAQEHIGKLREPERFRSWLYALTRNRCLRILAGPDLPEPRREAPEESDDAFLDAAERQRREETRRVVHSALAGLTGRQREALDLTDRHDLSVEELSAVLGTATQEATELVRRARDGLDGTLFAAIVARIGRDDCPSVAALVDGQSWPPSPELCRRLIRHTGSCPTCADHHRRRVSTTRLMRVLPAAAVPAELRMVVLSLAGAPDGHERRTRIAQRAEPFDVWGWPVGPDRARPRDQSRAHSPKLLPAIGAAAAVILLVGGVFLLTRGPSEPSHAAPSPALAAPSDPLSESPDPSDSTASPEPTTASPSPTHTTHHPTPTPTPTPTPVRTRTRPRPIRTTSKPPQPSPGTLAVTDCHIGLNESSCAITISAQDGPVTWKVTDLNGLDSASPDHGTLKNGESVEVVVTRHGACEDRSGTGSVTFSPNGTAQVSWDCLLLP